MMSDFLTIREMCAHAHQTSVAKGFVSEDPAIDQKLLLAVGELVEAQNEIRNGRAVDAVYYLDVAPDKPEGFVIELADAVIRIGQLTQELGLDLAAAIELKMYYNDMRSFRHGGKQF